MPCTVKSEFPCNVFVADGKIVPVRSFKYSINKDIDTIRGVGDIATEQIITGTSLSGDVSFREELIGIFSPRVSKLYIFTKEDGTNRRIWMEDVVFGFPTPDGPIGDPVTLKFVATTIHTDG